MVTGRPSMIVNSSTKSRRCIGSDLGQRRAGGRPRRRPGSSRARRRSGSSSKNMCSVRHRPMPSAPNWRAVLASSGVSALARTFRRRDLVGPAHQGAEVAGQLRLDHLHRAGQDLAGRAVDGDDVAGLEVAGRGPGTRRPSGSMWISPAPETQGRPMPRATTAAWLVMPPRAVRMPRAACMPWMSSGEVSSRTRITASPRPRQALGLVGVEHDLAGGRAGRGGQARGDHVARAGRVDGRVQQLVQRRRLDAA